MIGAAKAPRCPPDSHSRIHARGTWKKPALAILSAILLIFPSKIRAAPAISAYDFIELEISYTTLLARYYKPLTPRELVDGARTGVAAELVARGIDAELPLTPQHVEFSDGADLIDALVLRPLARYGAKLDGHALVTAAVSGELASLHDPYTVIFRPPAFKKFNAFLGNATFGGIGAVVTLDPKTQAATIERALPDSAAAKAGLTHGDEILAVDGKNVSTLANGEDLMNALRGKVGTTIVLDVRKVDGSNAHLTLTRAAVHDPEVHTARFGDVAYISLSRFGDKSGSEVAEAVTDAQDDGAKAIVFDLRGNGGGYGDEATNVASVFVPSGPIFTTRERGVAPVVSNATGKAELHVPLAVLVDGDTASAAEIVTGAIQDDGIGKIVGTRTFGKGLVQSVYPLPDGSAIKMTTARYTTPKGRDIDRVGIEPDVVFPEPLGSLVGDPTTDPQLRAALALVAPSP
jgi:carboxyl-terminal processing protease